MELESLFFNIADFKLQNHSIGEGRFSRVYVANNVNDNKNYAVKILNSENGFNGHDQMLLLQQSLILHKLKHPCIVKFKGLNFQSFKDPSKLSPSIITKYLPTGSLRLFLDKEKKGLAESDWTATKKFINLLGISRGMHYLHKHGVIHGNLKPENILTNEDFYPHICDYGLPLSNRNKLTIQGQINTELYIAPELFESDSKCSSSADIYAFGMLAYEIVTGELPFKEHDGLTAVSISSKISNGERPEIPDRVPEKMSNLIQRCWSQDPKDRPSFDEIFRELSSDPSMLGEAVDEDEIYDYIDMLAEREKEQGKIQKKKHVELNDLKKKFININEDFQSKERRYHREIESLKEANEVLKKKLQPSQVSNDLLLRGICKLWGSPKELNPDAGLSILKQLSEQGNSQASFILGLLYQSEKFVEPSFSKSLYYYQRSTTQGNTYGPVRLGICYHLGYGVEQSSTKALDCYKKAAEQMNSFGFNSLGFCYYNGFAVETNYAKALEYYTRAAELGNSESINSLGICYTNGTGVEQNYTTAIEYYLKAAELGNSNSYNSLGFCYSNGKGIEKNLSKAIECYEKSAEMGNPNAYLNLGICYESGQGVEVNMQKAVECYEKAAKLGNVTAKNRLSKNKPRGVTVESNSESI
ncbi:hypothetical protein M9Y10_006816 [Tritrichomonas musculus]|uniref:Protein kinase domain-containing protein n=1 Tax=Tritrichomonas musculus TaxID=1915356 RepID=A0ABR2JF69_9EUKA